MGFFKKIFKGVKKVFKKIGRGIKKVVKGVGKFMNKIGIVGQIALMFIPGIGPMLSTMFKGMGGIAAGALRAMGPIGGQILKGAQFVIGKAGKFITAGKEAFGTITDGIGSFVKEFTKTGLNKLGLDPTKFGFADVGSSTFSEAWGKVTTDITSNASKILDPFRSSIEATSTTTLQGLSDSAYHSVADIKQMNPQIRDWTNISGKTINLDMDNIMQMPKYTGSNFVRDFKAVGDPSIDFGLLPESVVGGSVTPSKAASLIEQGLPVPTQDSLLAFQRESQTAKMLGMPDPTAQNWVDFNKQRATAGAASTTSGFFDTSVGGFAKDVAVSSATSLATQGLMSLAAGDPPEAPDYGYVVNAGNVQVTGAGGAVDYGIGGDQLLAASLRPQATGLYDGTNTYAANLKAFYGLS